MTQDEIIRMAREAGFHIEEWSFGERVSVYESGKTIDITNELKEFAALAAAKLFTYEQVKAHIQAAVLSERNALAEQEKPNRDGLVYYKNNACKAKDAYSPDCICWTKAEQDKQEPVGTARELFTNAALERLDVRPSTKVYLSAAPVSAPEQEPVAWVSEDVCEGQYIDGRTRKIWWECKEGIGMAIYAAPVSAEAIRAQALEEAAKVCDELGFDPYTEQQCAAAIRARGEK